jgi:hypothetical protein
MRSSIAAFLLLTALMPARGEEPSVSGSRDFIDRPFEFDGKTVTYEGEAIGDPMRRGAWAWVNVLDGYAAIGIYMPSKRLELISTYGSHKARGDTLRIRGIFRRACPDHGGDMDIHADNVEILERGKPIPRPVDPFILWAIPVSFTAAALTFALWRKRKAKALAGTGDFSPGQSRRPRQEPATGTSDSRRRSR